MIKGDEQKPHVEKRHVDRVSSAFWPAQTRKGVSTGKAAQRRRDWIMQGRWWVLLIDALSMRVILVLTTLLVVAASLLVAVLGLSFWYLLLLPLLSFVVLLVVPLFLTSRVHGEGVPPLAPDMRSSAGFASQYAHEMRSSAGFVSQYAHEMRSSAGILSHYAHELRSEPGLLSGESPATPMPANQPLVRVLETYDLRATPVKHFLANFPEDTTEQAALRSMAQNFWENAKTEGFQGQQLPSSQIGPNTTQPGVSCPGELTREAGKEGELTEPGV